MSSSLKVTGPDLAEVMRRSMEGVPRALQRTLERQVAPMAIQALTATVPRKSGRLAASFASRTKADAGVEIVSSAPYALVVDDPLERKRRNRKPRKKRQARRRTMLQRIQLRLRKAYRKGATKIRKAAGWQPPKKAPKPPRRYLRRAERAIKGDAFRALLAATEAAIANGGRP